MEFRVLGPFVCAMAGEGVKHLPAWQPPLVTLLDPEPGVLWLRQELPNTFFIGRFYRPDEPAIDRSRDAGAEGRAYAQWQLKRAEKVLPLLDALQGIDEPAAESADDMKWLADFECERMRVLASQGARAALFSFADTKPGDFALLRAAVPAFREGLQFNAVYARHSFSWPTLDFEKDWRILRHRKEYLGEPAYAWEGIPKEYRLPLAITSCGLDGRSQGLPAGGWIGHCTGEQFLEQLAWLDTQLRADPYVLGACVFGASCGGEWASYSIDSLLPDLVNLANPLYRRWKPPAPELNPPRGIDVSVHQGTHFNWKAVRQAGYTFAFIRTSVGQWEDRNWKLNLKAAVDLGFVVGPYHFLTVNHPPQVQARVHAGTCADPRWKLPSTLDVETYEIEGGQTVKPTPEMVRTFLQTFKGLSNRPQMIYTSKSMWSRCIGTDKSYDWAQHDLWVADARGEPEPLIPTPWAGKGWVFWQTGASGALLGKPVDINVFNGTPDQFRQAW